MRSVRGFVDHVLAALRLDERMEHVQAVVVVFDHESVPGIGEACEGARLARSGVPDQEGLRDLPCGMFVESGH